MATTNEIIQRAAFEMFSNWIKIVEEEYPDMDFTIKDETELVYDTKATITNALKSLFSPENDEKRKDPFWCIGYVEGFIRGNLSEKWFSNYVLIQTDNYRYIIAVKSILEYVRVDSDLIWRLDAIYKELFKLNNLEQIKFQTQIDMAFFQKHDLPPIYNSGIAVQALDNLLVTLIKNLLEESSLEIPDKEYFSHEEIQSFIEKWEKKLQ